MKVDDKADVWIDTGCLRMACVECNVFIGGLIVRNDQSVNGKELSRFLRANNIHALCVKCHEKVFGGVKAMIFDQDEIDGTGSVPK